MNNVSPRSIYIHIPFCSHKCHYCDFTAYVVGGQPVDEYLDALEREMAWTVAEIPPEEIETIFIGGGTPTVLDVKQMERLLTAIRRYFPFWSDEIEYTIEANPGTTEKEKLEVMLAGGINRISFGAQTFRPDLLANIGRVHSVSDIGRSVETARAVGIHNISLDLMFGLPKQTVADMEEAIREGVALAPEHFSVYSLKVEEGTVFHAKLLQGKLPLPSEEDELMMYQLTRERLQAAGYSQYEISNFARPGKESKHNSTYWKNNPYYGLGAGAHGYARGVRHVNVKGVGEYIRRCEKGRPIAETLDVTRMEAMENEMILGLRLEEGVHEGRFRERFDVALAVVFGDVLATLEKKDLLQKEMGRWSLTEKGLLFGNDVFSAFLGEGVDHVVGR
ncbi:oxygen-independent coproporphyrinogen-3 oxidase [Marininema mesophilum]|uniref:Heme chaperone HemW n=1 Tax=Marininema mesophilum TaxID=1048340 RepID=A0A1H2R8M8_9BACL|nr:radical SAM family heme chaperone HemW [Marininema mesophilum]SDW15747.1 oxygen-independent coproporphyrinogen-3 oxidase [Marininema mesophilum]